MTVSPPASRPLPTAGSPRARVRRIAPVAALAAATVVLAGCGGDDAATTNAAATTVGTAPRPALADDVPARAAAFAEATVRPGGDAQKAVDQLLALVARERSGTKSGATKRSGLTSGLLPEGVSLREDVLPHVGEHVGAFLLGGTPAARTGAKAADGAIVAEVADAAALRKAVGTTGEAERVGAETIRVRDGHAVWVGDRIAALGSEKAVRAAIDAASGADLAGNARFTGALEQVRTTSPVGVTWVDLQEAPALNGALASLAAHRTALRSKSKARSSALDALPKSLRDRLGAAGKGSSNTRSTPFSVSIPATDATAALALELTPGKLVVRSGGTGAKPVADPKVGSDAVAALPTGSWVAFGGGASGLLAKGAPGAKAFDLLSGVLGTSAPAGLRDALAGVESVSGGAQGQNLLSARGGVVLRAKDDAAADALLKQLQGLFTAKAGSTGGKGGPFGAAAGLTAKPQKIDGTDSAFVVGLSGLPIQIVAATKGDRLAIGMGAGSVMSALATEKRFGDDPLHARAQELLGGVAPSLVLQPKPLTDLLGSLGGGLGGLLGGGMGGALGSGGSGTGGSSSGALGGVGDLLGSDGFGRVVDAAGRVKLVTAGRERTGSTTWRGSVVVEYDATPAKTPAKP